MSWIPVISFWAYVRIEKFWLGWMVNLGALGTFFGFISLGGYTESHLIGILGKGLEDLSYISGFCSFIFIHSYVVKKWSEEWNEKADEFNKEIDEHNRIVDEESEKEDTSKGVKL